VKQAAGLLEAQAARVFTPLVSMPDIATGQAATRQESDQRIPALYHPNYWSWSQTESTV